MHMVGKARFFFAFLTLFWPFPEGNVFGGRANVALQLRRSERDYYV